MSCFDHIRSPSKRASALNKCDFTGVWKLQFMMQSHEVLGNKGVTLGKSKVHHQEE